MYPWFDVFPLLRIARAGVIIAVIIGVGGWVIERARFGSSDETARERADLEVRRHIDDAAAGLRAMATRISAARETIEAAPRDQSALRTLFGLLAAELPPDAVGRTGLTVYDRTGTPLAWAGRVTDFPKDRYQFRGTIAPPVAETLAPGALGPHLVLTSPGPGVTVVAEQSFGLRPAPPGQSDTVVLATSIVPVTVRAGPGEHLFEADVEPSEITRAREQWDRTTGAAVVAVLAITLLFCAGPAIDSRRLARSRRGVTLATVAIAAILVGARVTLWAAARWAFGPRPITAPSELLLTALAAAALVWLAVDSLERRRTAMPRRPLLPDTTGTASLILAVYGGAGAAGLFVLWAYEHGLRRLVSQSTFDLLHF